MIQFEWRDLTWMLAVGALLSGALIAFVQWKLGAFFAKAGDVGRLEGRLAMVEARLDRVPSHDDLKALQARVGGLEREVAVVGEKVSGVAEIMKRVEHQTNLLVHHQLREGSGA